MVARRESDGGSGLNMQLVPGSVLCLEEVRPPQPRLVDELAARGWTVSWVRTGADALVRMLRIDGQLLLIGSKRTDGIRGVDVCVRLRKRLPWAGIVMLIASDLPEHTIAALEGGADDCVTNTMNTDEVIARLKAVERRASQRSANSATCFRLGPLSVDILACEAHVDGRRALLTMAQWAILVAMIRNAGRAVPREQLLVVGDIQRDIDGVNLRCIIKDLRMRLGRAGALVESERGVGYGFALRRDDSSCQLPTGEADESVLATTSAD